MHNMYDVGFLLYALLISFVCFNSSQVPVELLSTNPTAVVFPQHNNAEMDNHTQPGASRLSQLFSVTRRFKLSSLLDPNYKRSLLNELSASTVTPFVSRTEGTMGFPAEFIGRSEQPDHPGMPSVYDGITTASQDTALRDYGLLLFANNMEEEMFQSAIEASKQEDSSGSGLMRRQLDLLEDDEFSCSISLSLKTVEQEKAMSDRRVKNRDQQMEVYDLGIEAEKTNNSTREPGNSSVQGVEGMCARSPVSYKLKYDLDVHSQQNKDVFPSSEWGGISSKELQEVVMLEAALFNEILEATSLHSKHEPHEPSGLDGNASLNSASNCHPSSSSAMVWQLLREQRKRNELSEVS